MTAPLPVTPMKVEVIIGSKEEIAAMSSHQAAAHVRGLVEQFETAAINLIDSIRTIEQRKGARGPALTTTPSCGGCGMAVSPGEKFCEVCKQKPQFQAPPATRNLGAQPAPAYLDAPGQVTT